MCVAAGKIVKNEQANMKPRLKIRRRLLIVAVLLTVFAAAWIYAAGRACQRASFGRVFTSLETVSANDVGLVLGASRLTKHGKPNLHFDQRIAAAAALYHAGKIHHLLVSGDNHVATY